MLNSSRDRFSASTPSTTAPVTSRANVYAPNALQPPRDATRKYVVVSPVRDEARHITKTLQSVIHQTMRPSEWIIVDDGSRDETGRIIDEYAKQYPWIVALHRADRGQRVPGSGVMQAFYDGSRHLDSEDWEFVVRLDGDVGLERHYFQHCSEPV